jgi:hypothetical protein
MKWSLKWPSPRHDSHCFHGIETQLPPYHSTQYFTGAIHTHHPSPLLLISVTSIDGLHTITALLTASYHVHYNTQHLIGTMTNGSFSSLLQTAAAYQLITNRL